MEFTTTERQKQILRFVLNAQTLGVHSRTTEHPARSRRKRCARHFGRHHGRSGAPRRNEGEESWTSIMSAWQTIETLLKDLYSVPKDIVDEARAIINE